MKTDLSTVETTKDNMPDSTSIPKGSGSYDSFFREIKAKQWEDQLTAIGGKFSGISGLDLNQALSPLVVGKISDDFIKLYSAIITDDNGHIDSSIKAAFLNYCCDLNRKAWPTAFELASAISTIEGTEEPDDVTLVTEEVQEWADAN